MSTFEDGLAIGKQVISVARNDQVTFLAASIAFYAFLSIFPLLLLIIAIGSYVAGEWFTSAILEAVRDFLTPQARAVLTEAFLEDRGRSGAGIIGIVFLIWSALRVFRGLDIAFEMVYGSVAKLNFVQTVIQGIVVLAGIGLGIVAIVVLWVGLYFLTIPTLLQYFWRIPVFLTLSMLFFPMFYLFPRRYHGPRGALPGTFFAAGGWLLLSEVFAIYAAHAATFAIFGFIGAVLLLLIWFYIGASLILIGAVLNAVLAGRSVDTAATRGIPPSNPVDAEG